MLNSHVHWGSSLGKLLGVLLFEGQNQAAHASEQTVQDLNFVVKDLRKLVM